MRWATAWGLVVLLLLAPLSVHADSGRDAPTCASTSAQSLPPTLDVDDGACTTVDLGLLQPGDVYAMSIIVVDDAIDVLFFDQNGIQPYELGQSYRSSMAQPASTESALGALEFHWKVPPSISAKRWYMVLDNTAHDGDDGQGDQGGGSSTVSVSLARLNQAYWTPFNDLVAVDPGAYEVLFSGDELRLDAGTTVVLSAWDLTAVGDVYLQTRTQHDRYLSGAIGVQYIEGGALQAVETPKSLTWQVPTSLDGEELIVVVDNTDAPLGGGNGTEALRITVRLELAPPITPVITDDAMGTVSLGESLSLDASSTPNRLGQQGAFAWDLDDGVDADNDGVLTNDVDATGSLVDASWNLPGVKTVTVVMTAPSGETASTTHTITVEDTVPPVARMQTNGTLVSGGWRVNVNDEVEMTCASSTDDHLVATCEWTVDGVPWSNETTALLTPDEIRTYNVVLTVTDQSGNIGNVSGSIKSVDPTLPTFVPSSVANFPSKATQGETLGIEVEVVDLYDSLTDLRVHWDLQPDRDTDNNGNARDDPDREGLNPQFNFERAGMQDIVVTVFDASGNTDTYAFSIEVEPVPETPPYWTGGALLLVALTMLVAVAIAGYRSLQRNRGFNMLIQRGLDGEEAQAHMAVVAERSRIGWFAKAEVHAGLDAGDVVSTEDRRAAEKQAEMEAIYGGSNQPMDPNAGFAPSTFSQAPLSQASQSAAAEAAALLSDEGDETIDESLEHLVEEIAGAAAVSIDTEVAASASVAMPPSVALPDDEPHPVPEPAEVSPENESPVALPAPPAPPAPSSARHTCGACGAVFEVDVPAGVAQAVVACPACSADQTITVGD